MLPVGARCSACCLHVESWDERLIDEIGKSKFGPGLGKKIGRLLQVNTFLFGFSDLTGAGACLSSLNAGLYLAQLILIQQQRLFQDTVRAVRAMGNHPDLNSAIPEFLTQFQRDLESVRDVSRELDNKSRRAMGGFPIIYKTRWVPPGAPPIEVSFTLCPETGKFILLFA